ncbi:hypothetical protein [Brevibacillus laterosporus]|uniref:hypothetical protein n=1 Tax=Brevibacillus laterosporus TaxID=1465 RepID=UPI000839C404|nr:hypothetical protein [Brevibacillus laterosporus]
MDNKSDNGSREEEGMTTLNPIKRTRRSAQTLRNNKKAKLGNLTTADIKEMNEVTKKSRGLSKITLQQLLGEDCH